MAQIPLSELLGPPTKRPSLDELLGTPTPKEQSFKDKAWNAAEALMNNPVGDALSTIGGGLKDFATDTAAGVADPSYQFALGLQNRLSQGLGKVSGMPAERFGQYDVDSLAAKAPDPMLAEALSLPGALLAPGGAALKGAKGINALLAGGGLGALYGVGYGGKNPEGNVLEDAAVGAMLPAGMAGVGKLASMTGKGVADLAKSMAAKRMLNKTERESADAYSGVLTPDQAAQKLKAVGEEIPFDLGALVGDVKSAQKYKKGFNTYGSQVPARMQEAVSKTNQIANKMADELSQGYDEASGSEALLKHIKENYGMHKNEFIKLDDELANAASKKQIDTTNRAISRQAATDILDSLKETEMKGGVHFLSSNPSLKKLVENISRGGSPISVDIATGAPVKYRTNYDDLKNLRSYVGEQVGKLKRASIDKRDPEAIGELGKIYYALDDDMAASLKDHPDLLPLWKRRSEYYKNEVKPYEANKRVSDIVNSDEQANLFRKLNSTDPEILKAVDHMNPGMKKLLLGLGFKNAIKSDFGTGEMIGKPDMISKAYERLNNAPLLKHTLDESDHATFKKLSILNDLTKEYRPLLKNPETGAKNTKYLQEIAMSIPTALGLGAGVIAGHSFAPAAAMAAGTGAYIKGRNALNELRSNPKILEAYTNPKERNSLIKQAISQANETKKSGVGTKITTKALKSLSNPSLINYLLNSGNN